MKKKYFTTNKIATIAVMGALAAILMFFDVPLTFIAPNFYKMDVSDLPCLIGSFALGPVAGILIETVKIVIKLLLKPTSSAFVGELSNYIGGIALCLPAGILYGKNRTKKGAIRALIVSAVFMIAVNTLMNYFFIIPAYVDLYHMPLESIIATGTAIVPSIKDLFGFVLLCTLPFNAIKAILVTVLTYLLYKRVSPLLRN